MSLVATYRTAQNELKQLEARLTALHQSDAVQRHLEFSRLLSELMAQFSMTEREVEEILFPSRAVEKRVSADEAPRRRRQRVLHTYLNPMTGERIETRGSNHSILKAWISQYGREVVRGWKVQP